LVVTDLGLNKPPVIGISKKIEDQTERERLKEIAQGAAGNGMEVIVRTNAADAPQDVLISEFNKLVEVLNKSREQWQNVLPPALLHKVAGSLRKTITDLYNANVSEIIVNSAEAYEYVTDCLAEIQGTAQVVKLYDGEVPIFDMYAVEPQLEKAVHKRVWLKSGGFIVIERTEACVVIDVNSGKYSGTKSHEETVLKVNLEAAATIAEQLRLRNLSGIIIVDFIDMKEAKNIKLLTDRLIEETKKDRLTVNVIGMTELGLMQITRKKARKPLGEKDV
jgi:ribonuclease G